MLHQAVSFQHRLLLYLLEIKNARMSFNWGQSLTSQRTIVLNYCILCIVKISYKPYNTLSVSTSVGMYLERLCDWREEQIVNLQRTRIQFLNECGRSGIPGFSSFQIFPSCPWSLASDWLVTLIGSQEYPILFYFL